MKKNRRRLVGIIVGGISLLFWGFLMVDSLNHYCYDELVRECQRLWVLLSISILGSIIIFETILARHFRKDYFLPTDIVQDIRKSTVKKEHSVWSQAITKSVLRLTLGSILAAMPLLVRGMFVVTFGGIFVGISADLFVRGVMNWLPTKHKS